MSVPDWMIDAPVASVDDLRATIIKLARALRKAAPNHALPAQALDYLNRVGLGMSPLRAPSTPAATQMSTQHTPGPWFVVDCFDHSTLVEVHRRVRGPMNRYGRYFEAMVGTDGKPLTFRNHAEAHAAIAKSGSTS